MSTPIQATRDDHVSMDYLQSTPRRWVTTYIPLGIFVFVLLFPFYWMVVTSLKPNEELLARDGNPFWILKPTLAHFEKLILDRKSTRLNSSHVKRSRMPSSA